MPISRLFAFAREHQQQARAVGDMFRAELWDNILNELLDRHRLITSGF